MGDSEHQALAPLSPAQKENCKKAVELFEKGDFVKCSGLYSDLLSRRLSDYRLLHNLLVSDFWQVGCKGYDEFCARFFAILTEAGIVPENINAEDIVHPVLLLNLAVLYYHDKQPKKALDVVEKLARSCSNCTSSFTRRVKLLHILLYLKLHLFETAVKEIERFESHLRSHGGGSEVGSETCSLSPCSSVGDIVEAVAKTECDLQFDESMKIKLQEIKILCHLCTRSLLSAKREYKSLLNMSANSAQMNVVAQYLKAYYSYLRGNIKKGLTIITGIPENSYESFFETGDNMTMIFNNNVGCCHFALGKPTIAAWYFQKASQECDKAEYKDKQKLPLHCLSFNKKYEIMYNFGVALLHAKQPQEAFNVLCLCQKTFFSNPRLWHRIAECCVQLYKPSNEEDFVWTEEKRNILRGIQTQKTSGRKEECLSRECPVDSEKPKPTLIYALHCIETAIRLIDSETVRREGCLHVKPSNPITNRIEIRALQANILCTGAYIALSLGNFSYAITLCKELLALPNVPNVYHYLGKMYLGEALFKRGDVNQALLTLTEDNSSNYNLDLRYFLSVTGRDEESAAGSCSGCRRENETRNSSQSPPSSTSSNYAGIRPAFEWYPKDELTARAVVVYNRAVALASVGRYLQAAELIETWSNGANVQSLPPEFLILEIYLNLKLGNPTKAKTLLRKHCPATPINLPP